MVIDRHTTAQVATLRSAKHELPLQTQHIDGRYVALGFRISVIFQANNKMIIIIIIITIIITTTSTSVLGHSWLRHCATSRKVAGSIPDGVTGIFH